MKYTTHLKQSKTHKFPTTYVYSLLDGDLLIFLRPWGSQDYNQKFLDEVTHYLSSAAADIDVTTPFDFDEHLTSMTNRLKVALLIAHDFFFKVENKTIYGVGFEVTLLFKSKTELAWATVGRFDLYESSHQQIRVLSVLGSDIDTQQNVLLPLELLGVEKDFSLRCGSIQIQSQMQLSVASVFGPTNILDHHFTQIDQSHTIQSGDMTSLWSAQIELN